jgi:hypothetical protein
MWINEPDINNLLSIYSTKIDYKNAILHYDRSIQQKYPVFQTHQGRGALEGI